MVHSGRSVQYNAAWCRPKHSKDWGLPGPPVQQRNFKNNSATLERVCGTLRVCRGRCKVITHQKFQNGNLREAAKLARNDSAVSAETTMTLARAEMGKKPLDQGLSLRFEKHEVALQFDMFVMWLHEGRPPCFRASVHRHLQFRRSPHE